MQPITPIPEIFAEAKLPVEQVANSWQRGCRRAKLDKHQRRQRRYRQNRAVALRIIAEKPDDPEAIRQAHAFLDAHRNRITKWAMRTARADAREGKREERIAKRLEAAARSRESIS